MQLYKSCSDFGLVAKPTANSIPSSRVLIDSRYYIETCIHTIVTTSLQLKAAASFFARGC